jgi:hypothetical protein
LAGVRFRSACLSAAFGFALTAAGFERCTFALTFFDFTLGAGRVFADERFAGFARVALLAAVRFFPATVFALDAAFFTVAMGNGSRGCGCVKKL